jgi:hypothetical protein
MKQAEWINPNKMLFESADKTFNRQCKVISRGNVWSDNQYSGYVRAYNNTEIGYNKTCKPGYLQEYDLKQFRQYLPQGILNYAKNQAIHNSVILYVFKHFNGDRRIIDGAILTDDKYNHIKSWYLGGNWKADSILDEARKYITNENLEGAN